MTPPNTPLAGRLILVARPAGQADELMGLIEAAGGKARHLPLLEIAPVADPGVAARQLARTAHWDWLFFVSRNAVQLALPLLPAPGLLTRPRIAAIGTATARTLADAGFRVDLQPAVRASSETLLESPELKDVAGRNILIVRGEGGREHLAEVLRERGANVEYAEVYRRVRVAPSRELLEQWRGGAVAAVLLTSGEALGQLMAVLGQAGPPLAAATPLVVIGERIGQLARASGWQCIVVAEETSDRGLLAAIEAFFAGPARRTECHLPRQDRSFASNLSR